MDSCFESKYHSLEKNHFWFKARRDMILQLLRYLQIPSEAKIADVGCSGGILIETLQQAGYQDIWGIDMSEQAIEHCQAQGIMTTLVGRAEKTNFLDEQFNVVIASDILEHIEDEEAALIEWRRILKFGGKLIIFVPAFNFLWSGHDEKNFHFRRYTKSSLLSALQKAGFLNLKTSYWNFFLFFISVIQWLSNKILRKKSHKVGDDRLFELPHSINAILTQVIKCENRLLRFISFPLGLSVYTLCEKNEKK